VGALMRVRFAPSPTGMFHVGSARSALLNWIVAKQVNGAFVLRIEDTDADRNKPEWTQGIIDAMAWLGMSSDDPVFEGPYFQSHNVEAHVAAAHRLFESGHAYYCDLPPGEKTEKGGEKSDHFVDPIARSKTSRDKGLGPAPDRVLRFRVPDGVTLVRDTIRGEVEFANDAIEDFVILRGNGSPLFLIANVVDDITHQISHVIRGEEHFSNTPKQQMMWDALGVAPPVWAHVPVLVNEQRKKLSKRRDKVALEAFRDEGYVMPAMRNYLMLLGWSPGDDQEIVPWEQILRDFRIDDVIASPAFFDLKKLGAFNGEYIRAMSADEFVAACQPWVDAWCAEHPEATWNAAAFRELSPVLQMRAVTLADVPAQVDYVMFADPVVDPDGWSKTMGTDVAAPILTETITAYATSQWTADALKMHLEEISERLLGPKKLGKAQAPPRVAVTGRTVGPPLFEILEVLGRDETLRRLKVALDKVSAPG
jgi:glutamyl-tRNA synthetase